MKNRKRLRLKDYDYSQSGNYFVTICTKDRVNQFGKISNNKMELNRIGVIVKEKWKWLEEQYPYVILDEFIVMPNHIHGIIVITDPLKGNGHDRSLLKIKTLSSLIGAFKTTSSKEIHLCGHTDFKWQKSFYDRIIRNVKEFENIQAYIHYNQEKWELDTENKTNESIDKEKYYDNILKGVKN